VSSQILTLLSDTILNRDVSEQYKVFRYEVLVLSLKMSKVSSTNHASPSSAVFVRYVFSNVEKHRHSILVVQPQTRQLQLFVPNRGSVYIYQLL